MRSRPFGQRWMTGLTLATFSAVGVVGLISGVAGPTLSGLAEQTGVTMARIGLVITARSIGYLIGALTGGLWVDRRDAFRLLGGILMVAAVSLAAVSWADSWWLLLAFMALMGWTMGGLDVAGNALILRLHRARPEAYLHALHLFYGLGGLAAPLIASALIGLSNGVAWTYRVLALLPLVFVPVLLRAPVGGGRHRADDRGSDPRAESTRRRMRPAFVLGASFYLFYVGGQIALVSWLYPYVEAVASPRTATWTTGAFWAAFTLFRLIGIPASRRWSPDRILRVDFAIVLVAALPMLVWHDSILAVWIGAAGMGAGHASIYASGVLLLSRRETLTGRHMGLIVAFSCVGSMLFPWLMGLLFEAGGPIAVPAVSILLMGMAFGVSEWIMRSRRWNRVSFESDWGG